MIAILDNLTAILVGASLLTVLLFVQQRDKQSAVENTLRYRAQEQAATTIEILERDLDNVRFIDTDRPRLERSGDVTTLLRFHTLAEPGLGSNSPLVAVTYRLEDTFRTMDIGGVARSVYRIARYVNNGSGYVYDGGSSEGVRDFDVSFSSRDGATEITNGTAPDGFARVRVSLASAVDGIGRRAGDQAATGTTNLTEQGASFRPAGLTATEIPPAPGTTPSLTEPLPPPPGRSGVSVGSGGDDN